MLQKHTIVLVSYENDLTPESPTMDKVTAFTKIPIMRDCVLFCHVTRSPGEILDIELRDSSSTNSSFTLQKLPCSTALTRVFLGTLHSPLHVWWHFHNKLPPPPQGAERSLFKTRMSIEVVGVVDLPAPRKKRT